jgi:hypothetical protein
MHAEARLLSIGLRIRPRRGTPVPDASTSDFDGRAGGMAREILRRWRKGAHEKGCARICYWLTDELLRAIILFLSAKAARMRSLNTDASKSDWLPAFRRNAGSFRLTVR